MHTPEQIETWARESGVLNFTTQRAGVFTLFAALVAQHERERAAKLCESIATETIADAKEKRLSKESEATHFGFARGSRTCAAAIRNSDGG